MITYIPNINQWQGLGLELLVMIPYNIYIIYINANKIKTGVLQRPPKQPVVLGGIFLNAPNKKLLRIRLLRGVVTPRF